MEEAQGQAVPQPVLMPEEVTPEQIAQELVKEQEEAERPRDESGKFKAKEEAKPEEQAPKEETPEEPAEESPPPRKLKLNYKGEEKEVDESEAVELAQKGYDYTQKTQQLAKEREELNLKMKAEAEKFRSEYENKLSVQKKALEKFAGLDIDLAKLAQEDPVRAQQEYFRQLQFKQQINEIEAEQNRLASERQSEFQEALRKQASESREKLSERINGWNNDLYGKILKAAVSDYGFSQQEANNITDHRAIEVLNDARQWREFQAAKPKTADKRIASAPKVQKPGGGEKPDPKATKLGDLEAKFNKSGDQRDLTAYFEEQIRQGLL